MCTAEIYRCQMLQLPMATLQRSDDQLEKSSVSVSRAASNSAGSGLGASGLRLCDLDAMDSESSAVMVGISTDAIPTAMQHCAVHSSL